MSEENLIFEIPKPKELLEKLGLSDVEIEIELRFPRPPIIRLRSKLKGNEEKKML
jgi:hypothetical protein